MMSLPLQPPVGSLLLGLLMAGQTVAQAPAPAGTDLATFAARRHPQPVRVGDLIQRNVLEPLESRPVLGRVVTVIRANDGTVKIVMTYGGWLGFGTRSIAVPTDAMVLLGSELEVLDFTPQQLAKFPDYQSTDGVVIDAGATIRMGLAHPSH